LSADGFCENDSDRDAPLKPDVVEALRSVPVAFAYYAKHPSGDARLRATCDSLGLKVHDVFSVVDSSRENFRLAGLTCASEESKRGFVGFLHRRGQSLITQWAKAKKAGWDEHKAAQFALGFGDLDLTIVFRHSISASTPVALWMMSHAINDYWIPLFPRRRQELLQILEGRDHGREPLPEYYGSD
jgi:hypothetical protein